MRRIVMVSKREFPGEGLMDRRTWPSSPGNGNVIVLANTDIIAFNTHGI
jgi:hypothetical protein